MKVTNLTSAKIYLKDLRVVHASSGDGRRGEDFYLGPGVSKYLLNTSEVLRSAHAGDLYAFRQAGKISLEDDVTLGSGASVVLTHNFHFAPAVSVVKFVSPNWVDGTGTVDVVHNATFTTTTVTNATGGTLRFLIRLL